jgi:CTP:molybdopterin cytidylyltransferase MocA
MPEDPTPPPSPIGAVLLAAGGSTRMGRPKQLLEIDGVPLVLRAARALLQGGLAPVVVVAGRDYAHLAALLRAEPVAVVENPDWERGMGTSLSAGVRTWAQRAPEGRGVLIALVDQPALEADHVRRLAAALAGPGEIAAAAYAGVVGAPVVFGRDYLPELLALPAAAGAQALLRRHAARVTPLSLPELSVDLDTPGQYEAYRQSARLKAST